jgi:hypothetical protein
MEICFHLDEIVIVKFYLFLSVMFMMMIIIILINRIVPEFLGLSVIGLILLKFGLMYLIRKN